jgi:hypothetical protein
MAAARCWDIGWYGDRFVITLEDESGVALSQVSLPRDVALQMMPALRNRSAGFRMRIPVTAPPVALP